MILLSNLLTRSTLKRPAHIIGLTAYEDLAIQHSEQFDRELWYLVRYFEDSDDWTHPLERRLIHIADSKIHPNTEPFRTGLAIITAIPDPELEAILALKGSWREHRVDGDDTVYHKGRFHEGGDSIEVVAATAIEMGMPAATALAMKMISHFRPRYLAMAGIAAGVHGDFGDILVADQTWDYGSGKSRTRRIMGCSIPFGIEFSPAPSPILISPLLKARFDLFSRTNKSVLKDIRFQWDGKAPANHPKMMMGPVASGAAVLENRPLINRIKRTNRKLIGIEMETYGMFLAARISSEPRPLVFSVKSICDFGDSRKSDDYQKYASFTSANYIYKFSLSQLT